MGNEIYRICSSSLYPENNIYRYDYYHTPTLRQSSLENNTEKQQSLTVGISLSQCLSVAEMNENKENYYSLKMERSENPNQKDQEVSSLEEKIQYLDGSEYIGQINNNLRQGKGKLFNPEKVVIYEGHWDNDKPHGFGRLIYENDLLYVGDFESGTKNGEGKICSLNEKIVYFKGSFKQGEKNGIGEEHFADKSIYIGNYSKGKRDGIGKYILPDGGYYEGQFTDDKIEGKGYFFWNLEKSYEGEWKNNTLTGFGIYKQKGVIYKGYFLNDKKHGFGTYLYPMNSFLVGRWIEDTMEGIALLINYKKEERLFKFEKGKLVLSISDQNIVKKIKNDIEYLNLKVFLEELTVKGLYN